MPAKVIIYNPKRGSDIKDFRWAGGVWKLGLNKMSKFPAEIAQEMLNRFRFLIKVQPEEVSDIVTEMTAKTISCPHCDKEYGSEAKLKGHILGKHKVTAESKKILDSIPDAQVVEVKGGKKL
ncbi:hypothetical protein LCGC14_3156560 [marine sediment metagenome]|uniref:C2H2-type domain-containing protein n=1 Tax=marine sediment metagenome TaxID=412755 RepID=A0A0F8VSJ1_9ZZZZ